jgi:hypothetical protein
MPRSEALDSTVPDALPLPPQLPLRPPLRFNFGKSGLSSISLSGRGASFNIPVVRSGSARTTVGLPGTGLSWSVEHSPEANRLAAERLPVGPAEGLP